MRYKWGSHKGPVKRTFNIYYKFLKSIGSNREKTRWCYRRNDLKTKMKIRTREIWCTVHFIKNFYINPVCQEWKMIRWGVSKQKICMTSRKSGCAIRTRTEIFKHKWNTDFEQVCEHTKWKREESPKMSLLES